VQKSGSGFVDRYYTESKFQSPEPKRESSFEESCSKLLDQTLLHTMRHKTVKPKSLRQIRGISIQPFGTHQNFNDMKGRFRNYIDKKNFMPDLKLREFDLSYARMTSKRKIFHSKQRLSLDQKA
jgi:hypothetical protein